METVLSVFLAGLFALIAIYMLLNSTKNERSRRRSRRSRTRNRASSESESESDGSDNDVVMSKIDRLKKRGNPRIHLVVNCGGHRRNDFESDSFLEGRHFQRRFQSPRIVELPNNPMLTDPMIPVFGNLLGEGVRQLFRVLNED